MFHDSKTGLEITTCWERAMHLVSLKISCLMYDLSRRMGKPTICIGGNKGADQLHSNCEADQRLCFRYTDSTIPLLSKSKLASNHLPRLFSWVCVGTCRNPNCWFSHAQAKFSFILPALGVRFRISVLTALQLHFHCL